MSTLAKYPRATTFAIYSLGIFLGLIHLAHGLFALTSFLSQDYHRDTRVFYNAIAKTLVFAHAFVDRVTLALYLRYFIGGLQAIFGLMLIENGYFGSFGRIGNYGLILVDLLLVASQLTVGHPFERIAPMIVFTVLLATRLLIVAQGSKKVKPGVKTRNAGKPKTSTPKKNKNE